MSEDKIIRELSELGGFGLIEHLTRDVKLYNESTIKGIGDDAAIIDSGNRETVITTDTLTEGIDFDLVYFPIQHLGYKAVTSAISDLCAMNAKAEQILISIAMSSKFSVEALDSFYEGINIACAKYNVDFIGGDTSASLTGLTINITAIGSVEKGKAVLRSTAKENDIICVSGDLGSAYMGLQLLEREKKVFLDSQAQPQLAGYEYILGKYLKPEARYDILERLEDSEITPTSMIDVSDGLASEIMHICKQSKVGCRIYQEKIPLEANTDKFAEEIEMTSSVAALNGGEDYELLFTVPVADFEKVEKIEDIRVIGHITNAEDGLILKASGGEEIVMKAQGWK